MQAHRHEIARMQSDFYRDQFRKTLRKMVRLIVVIFVLIAAIAYLIFTQTAPAYYANTTDGMILAMPMPGGAAK